VAGPGEFGFEAVVELVEYLGDERLAHVRLGERLLTAKMPAAQELETGSSMAFTVPGQAVLLFDAETGLAVDSSS
jgi:multiple sugar transport system ATP-binding protein